MNLRIPFFLLVVLVSIHLGYAQTQGKDYIRLMFYNVENYFDAENDSATNDDDFTPSGQMRWTHYQYSTKRNHIFKVMMHVGGWDPPAIVGLCEVENLKVLSYLLKATALAKYPYRIIHKDSPDLRGIDVALLYRSDYLKCIHHQFIHVDIPGSRKRTRDILYARLCTGRNDTLHVFVNHWPSRSGGQRQSEQGRIFAARLVREKVDSLFGCHPLAGIVITGDLNDSPSDKSLTAGLGALNDSSSAKPSALFNLSAFKTDEVTGTIKYQGRWSVFDQIIVSGGLLRGPLRTDVQQCQIFRADYLLEPDQRYMSTKPFRTYYGPAYHGGFSDHLPVFLDMFFITKN